MCVAQFAIWNHLQYSSHGLLLIREKLARINTGKPLKSYLLNREKQFIIYGLFLNMKN
jgi:hypothetical protein